MSKIHVAPRDPQPPVSSSPSGAPEQTLTDLPVDILSKIFGHTSGGLVLRMASQNRQLQRVARSDQTFKQLADNKCWAVHENVVDITRQGAWRDAYQVQSMEKKVVWDTLGETAKQLTRALKKNFMSAPGGRGCAFNAATQVHASVRLGKQIARVRKQQSAITQELEADYLAITGKGWKRSWG